MTSDLFTGTSYWYSRYRPEYPWELFELLQQRCSLDGYGRLLDVGTGPGQIALPFSRLFDDVVAIDQDAEMLNEARRGAEVRGVNNIEWSLLRAEEIHEGMGPFRMVTIGNAFHWMDQEKVLQHLFPLVTTDGSVVIIEQLKFSPWNTPLAGSVDVDTPLIVWNDAVRRVMQRFLGEQRRAGSGLYRDPTWAFEDVIERSPFSRVEVVHLKHDNFLTIESQLGLLYSTSFCSRKLLGDDLYAFEDALRQELRSVAPSGICHQEIELKVSIIRR